MSWPTGTPSRCRRKAAKGVTAGPLDGVAAALPALEKARKLQSKAAKQGLLDRRAVAYAEPALAVLLGERPDESHLGGCCGSWWRWLTSMS